MAIRRIDPARLKERGKGRHPRLRLGTDQLTVYNYIKKNPDCTWADIKAAYGVHPQTLSTLRDEGLVVTTGKRDRGHTFRVVPENVEGRGRDDVAVELSFFVNDYGEYSISARLLGELEGATDNNPRLIKRRVINTKIPRPEEPYLTRDIIDEALQISASPVKSASKPSEPITIDADMYSVEISDVEEDD